MHSVSNWLDCSADYTYICTLLASCRQLALTICLAAARWELAGTDYIYLCTLPATDQQLALTSCQAGRWHAAATAGYVLTACQGWHLAFTSCLAAECWQLTGADYTYLCILLTQRHRVFSEIKLVSELSHQQTMAERERGNLQLS
jgi:hypothetical protein